jgi:hypothetical protein
MSTKTTFKRIALVTVAALGVSILGTSASYAGADTVTYEFAAEVSPTLKPAVGAAVLIPISATVDVDPTEAGATGIVTATITTKPVGSTLAAESTTAAINLATIDTGTTGVTLETVTASAGAVKLIAKAGTTNKATAETATVISFTPDAPGYYVITLTASGTGTETIDGGATATYGVVVAGASAVQASSGIGTAAAKQLLGRQSAVAFYLPVGTTTASRYEITSTGIGIQGIFEMGANLTNVASATDATAITRVTKNNGTDYAAGATYAGRATVTGAILVGSPVRDGILVTMNSAVAAVGTITVKSIDGATGEPTTIASATVTYAAAVVVDTKADATSTSILAKGAIANSAQILDSATVSAAKTAGTQAGTIYVTQKSAIATAVPAESMTVSITGPGLLGSGVAHTAAATGRSLIVKNGDYITVWPDGTSGEATITIVAATSGVTLGVEKITFFDNTPASAAVTVSKTHVLAGTGSVDGVFLVVVKDASGNAVTNIASLTGAPTDTATTQLVGGAATCSTTYSTTKLGYICSVVGKSATKFGKVNYTFVATASDAAKTELKATADVTFSFGVAKTVEVTGPTTAGYGEEITLTFTAKDENGLPVADQTYEGSAANGTTGGIFWNTTTVPVYVGSGFAPFNSGETITTVSGVATKKITTPTAGAVASATWTLAGTGLISSGAVDKSIGNTKVVYSVALNNPAVDAATDAANEAVDAANAATDAALAAAEAADAATSAAQEASDAVAALSESVTKLIAGLQAQIKSLAAVVAKIAKKVKA